MASQAVDGPVDFSEQNPCFAPTRADRLISRISRWSGIVLLVAAVVSLTWLLLA